MDRFRFDSFQAEAGSEHPAGAVGAVEALEDVREVGFREAGAVVADLERAVAQRDLDHAARRAPLDGVVEQVRDRAVDAAERDAEA